MRDREYVASLDIQGIYDLVLAATGSEEVAEKVATQTYMARKRNEHLASGSR